MPAPITDGMPVHRRGRPRGVIRIVAAAAMTFVLATATATTGTIPRQGRAALGASTTLSVIAGDVATADPGSSDFRPVSDGSVLVAGARVRTGGSARAVLTYGEGSTMSLGPNTTVVIAALLAVHERSTLTSVRQQLGRTWCSVSKLLGRSSKYEAMTTSALTATVRARSGSAGGTKRRAGSGRGSLGRPRVERVAPIHLTSRAVTLGPAAGVA